MHKSKKTLLLLVIVLFLIGCKDAITSETYDSSKSSLQITSDDSSSNSDTSQEGTSQTSITDGTSTTSIVDGTSSTSITDSTSSTSITDGTSESGSDGSSEISSEPDFTDPQITPLKDTFNLDENIALTYKIDIHQNQFLKVKGFGISDADYHFDGSTLTIRTSFLKYFTKVGNYKLDVFFATAEGEKEFPLHFQIIRPNHEHRIINGDFETGDFHGWNGYQLWKDESGMFAFRDERIVGSATYGSSNTHNYNRDGSYHLGVYTYPYNNDNKNINQERMGMLRSSDFILGGSGWISFKLGGGQNSGVSYVSIKETGTDVEIARYGNRHFGNTAIASATAGSTINNAEAFMFPYFANLSAHIGKSLYVLLTDGAGHEWSVLAADSIETYYPTIPSASQDQLAIDIKPNIYGANNASNSIVNSLASTVELWEDPHNVFHYTERRARTNRVGGDNALGVVRSPAFKVDLNGNNHLTWEWEGALKLDKQIFLSIKEVNTNIEVLRLVRRDNLKDKVSGSMDRHWYNLSSLSPNKEYYVELVDNAKGAWGLISLRNIELVDAYSDKISSSGDKAVNVFSGLARVDFSTGGYRQKTTFVYNPITTIANVMVSLGEVASEQAIINYHTSSKNTWLEFELSDNERYTIDSDTFYEASYDVKRVQIAGLTAGETYRYRLYDRENALDWHEFKTPQTDSFTFAFGTDSQSTSLKGAHVYNQMFNSALSFDNDISFGLITGDVVERGGSVKMWQWFYEATEIRKQFAINAITGNHDYFQGDQNDSWTDNKMFERHIPHPHNGISPYSSYYFKVGPVLFIMLDAVVESNHGLDQADWFRNVVNNNPHSFAIVGTHYSVYGAHHKTRSSLFRNDWAPIFDECEIDLVLSGHDHVFTRTEPKRNGVTNHENGTVYLSGGSVSEKIYDIDHSLIENYAFAMTEHQNVIHIININNDRIEVKSINIHGNIVDQFQIS